MMNAWRSLLTIAALCLGGVSWLPAQTSGATAPEVTQFEPVDISDLVNLSSGDFHYAIPAMEIPGAPGGSYPLSLNYAAGIRYDQEASWVGLGWNLSPGSISRAVRGLPDDYDGERLFGWGHSRETIAESLSFSYAGFSVGVNWDNHGGFGGSVGYGWGNMSVNASYYRTGDGQTIYGGGLGFGGDGGNVSIGYSTGINGDSSWNASVSGAKYSLNYNYSGGFSGSLGGKNLGISYSSNGTLGFNVGGFSIAQGNGTTSIGLNGFTSSRSVAFAQSATNTASTRTSSKNYYFYGKTKSRMMWQSLSFGYGYLNTEHIGEDMTEVLDASTIDTSALSVRGGKTVAQQVAEIEGRNRGIDTLFRDGSQFNNLNLDFYFQDYGALSQRAEADDDYGKEATYESDYIAPTYDIFNIAAQGASGVARPIPEQRGFLKPSDNVFKVGSDDTYYYPYRALLHALGQDGSMLGSAAGLNGYFSHDVNVPDKGRWAQSLNTSSAAMKWYPMMLLDDPATKFATDAQVNQPFFSPDPDAPVYSQIIADSHSHLQPQATQIRYRKGAGNKIEEITVIKPDGMRYRFGRIFASTALVSQRFPFLGAAPLIWSENRYTATSTGEDLSQPTTRSGQTKTGRFAYAWYLAAVESPDYLDRGTPGYDPEDYGQYVAFRYAPITNRMAYASPFSVDPFGEGAPFMVTGYDHEEDEIQWERTEGIKELYVPYMAETRTHVALFSFSTIGQRKDHKSHAGKNKYFPQSTARHKLRWYTGETLVLPHMVVEEDDLAAFDDQIRGLIALGQGTYFDPGFNYTTEDQVLIMPQGTGHRLRNQVFNAEFLIKVSPVAPDFGVNKRRDDIGYPIHPLKEPDAWAAVYSDAVSTDQGNLGISHEQEQHSVHYLGTIMGLGVDLFIVKGLELQYNPGQGEMYRTLVGFGTAEAAETKDNGHVYLREIGLYDRDQIYDGYLLSKAMAFPFKNDGDVPFPILHLMLDGQLPDKFLRKTSFSYDYRLAGGTPNSEAAAGIFDLEKGRLTLTGVDFYGWHAADKQPIRLNPGFRFGYYNAVNPNSATANALAYDKYYHKDPWGYLSKSSFAYQSVVDVTTLPIETFLSSDEFNATVKSKLGLTGYPVPIQAAWNLKRIDTPVGTRIMPIYERDRYTWVQDRLALPTGLMPETLAVRWQSRLEEGDPEHVDHLFYGSFEAGIISRLRNINIPLVGGENDSEWKKQVLVTLDVEGNIERYRFVIPVEPNGPDYRFAMHAALRDLYLVGSSLSPTRMRIYALPVSENGYPPMVNPLTGSGMVGQLGGGLRVKHLLKMSTPPFGSGLQGRLTMTSYDYTDPYTGLESGAIFMEPPGMGNVKSKKETQTVLTALHPYLNFPGADVNYAFVRMKTGGMTLSGISGLDKWQVYGEKLYHMATARMPMVSQPVGRDSGLAPLSYLNKMNGYSLTKSVDTYEFQELLINDPAGRWKPRHKTLKFRFDAQHRQVVVNNTSLIGSPLYERSYEQAYDASVEGALKSEVFYDTQFIQETLHRYGDAFSGTGYTPNWNTGPDNAYFTLGRPLATARFSQNGGELQESLTTSLNLGLWHAKSAAALIKQEEAADTFSFRLMMVDEIKNMFRSEVTTTTLRERLDQGRALVETKESYLYDYYTGTPLLAGNSRHGARETATPLRYEYTLNIPAHQISQSTVPGRMTNGHMWIQGGLSASFSSELKYVAGAPLIHGLLADTSTTLLGATATLWDRPDYLAGGPANASVALSQFGYTTDAEHAVGWLKLPAPGKQGNRMDFVQNRAEGSGNGAWVSTVENTKYDRYLNVVEARSIQEIYSAAYFTTDGRYLMAHALNAQHGQVFYEGFEPDTMVAGTNSTMTSFKDAGESQSAYLDNFRQVFSGTGSFTGHYLAALDPDIGIGLGTVDNRTTMWLSFYTNGPEGSFVTANGREIELKPASIPGQNPNTIVVNMTIGNTRTWWLVRVKIPLAELANGSAGLPPFTLSINAGSHEIDEVLLYPAANKDRNEAMVEIYGYHPHHRKLISIVGANGYAARFEYDKRGQLLRVFDPKGLLKSEYWRSYHGERLDVGISGLEPPPL